MKKVFTILFLIGFFIKSNAQEQSNWTQWKGVLNVGCGPEIFYRIQFPGCNENGIKGWPKVELKHNDGFFNASLQLKLKGVDCDGKSIEMDFNTTGKSIPAWTPYSYKGNWHNFKRVDEVLETVVEYDNADGEHIKHLNHYVPFIKCEKFINGRSELEVINERLKKKEEFEKAQKEKALQEMQTKKEAQLRIAEDKKRAQEKVKEEKKLEAEKMNKTSKNDSISKNTSSKNTNSYYSESDESKKLRERAKFQSDKNKTEDESMIGTVGSVFKLGATIASSSSDDEYEDKDMGLILRAIIGANMQNIPVTKNYYGIGFMPSSESGSTTPININAEIDIKLLNRKFIGFGLNPFANFGALALSSNTGGYFNYGSYGSIKFGHDLSLNIKGAYEHREGSDTYDAAEIGVDGLINSRFNYSTIKYGVGIKYTFMELAMYKENISFLKSINTQIFSYEFIMAYKIYGMTFKYSPNYPIAGEVKYSNSYEIKKQSYFHWGMYWMITLARHPKK